MGKQINYYMGVDDFRQLAQYALYIGCVICKQENAEIVSSNSVDIVMPDYKKYFFYLPEAEKALLQLQDDKQQIGGYNKSGNIVIDYQYDRVTEVDEYGYAGIKQDGKWGAIDNQGKVVVEPTFDLQEEIDPTFMGVYHKVNYGFGEFYFEDLRV